MRVGAARRCGSGAAKAESKIAAAKAPFFAPPHQFFKNIVGVISKMKRSARIETAGKTTVSRRRPAGASPCPRLTGGVDFARVESGALGWIGQKIVRGAHFLEFFLGALVIRIHVRVQIARKLAIGAFDLVLRGRPGNAQYLVWIVRQGSTFVQRANGENIRPLSSDARIEDPRPKHGNIYYFFGKASSFRRRPSLISRA